MVQFLADLAEQAGCSDLCKIAGHPPEQMPEHQNKYKDDRRRKEDLFIFPETAVVDVKSLLMPNLHKIFQSLHSPVSKPPPPQKQIQDDHNKDRAEDIKTKPPHDLSLKCRIFFPFMILQFCIRLPISS